MEELDPYYYHREHDGSGWSVRGPDGLVIKKSPGEPLDKNEAYIIAKILSGKWRDAFELLQTLVVTLKLHNREQARDQARKRPAPCR